MFGEGLVEERVVGVKDLQHRPVAREQVLEEQDAFLEEQLPEPVVEGREELLVLLPVLLDVPNMEPLGCELGGQSPRLRVAQHPRNLHRTP